MIAICQQSESVLIPRTFNAGTKSTKHLFVYEYQLMSYIFVFQMYQYVQRHDLMQQNWISGHRLSKIITYVINCIIKFSHSVTFKKCFKV
jgi:hypothetical protein